jgi:hypothetical protein
MPTPKQTAANRTSSQKSTGPRTTGGQAASRYNPLKHGIFATTQIMFDESAEDLAGLAAEYHEHHSPAEPGQRFLVDTLVNNEWRLRRLRRVEAELWEHATNTFLAANTEAPACSSGDAFATASPTFERLQRVANSCERIYHRALKELHHLKVGQMRSPADVPDNPGPPPGNAEPAQPSQPKQSKAAPASSASFRQNPETPPPAVPKPPDAPPPAPASAGPLHAPASPATTWPTPSDRFPDPMEAIDAALRAISKKP